MVYSLDGKKIGSIERLMIDKISGKLAYAVMSLAVPRASAKTTTRCRGRSSPITKRSTATKQVSVRSYSGGLPTIASTNPGTGRAAASMSITKCRLGLN